MLADRFDPRYFDHDVLFRYHAGWAGPTFSRASPATYLDRSGILRTAGPDVPRVTWRGGVPYLLVEGETTNLIPVERQTFEGWTAFDGAVVTITQGQTIQPTASAPGSPEGAATRIQTIGGGNVLKYFFVVSGSDTPPPTATSVLVHNRGAHPVVVARQLSLVLATVAPGETALVAVGDATQTANRHLQFRAMDAAHDLDVVAYAPQIEASPVATSYIPDTRATDLIRTPWHHPPMSMAVYEAGIEAGLREQENARAWQIGAGVSVTADRAFQVYRVSDAAVRAQVSPGGGMRTLCDAPGVPLGAEYERLALLEIKGTQARVGLLQRYREGDGPWQDASGEWSTPIDVTALLAQGWQAPWLTIGNVYEGTRPGRMLLRDLIGLRGSHWTMDQVRRLLPW